jgi:hypothetical protein
LNSEQNKQLVLDLWKAFAERNFQRIFDDGLEWIAPEGNATAVASNGPSHLIGKEAVMQFITSGFRKIFQEEVYFEIRNIYADGNTVIVEQAFQARVANGNFYKKEASLKYKGRGSGNTMTVFQNLSFLPESPPTAWRRLSGYFISLPRR